MTSVQEQLSSRTGLYGLLPECKVCKHCSASRCDTFLNPAAFEKSPGARPRGICRAFKKRDAAKVAFKR